MKGLNNLLIFLLIGFLTGQGVRDLFFNKLNMTAIVSLIILFIWSYVEKPFRKKKNES